MGIQTNSFENEQFSQLEFIKTGSIPITSIPDSTAVATVTHNLGFTPIVFAFMETAGSLLNLQNFPTFGFDTTNNDIFGIQELVYGADKTTVGFALNDAGSLTIAYNIKYYLYRLRIN